MSGTIYQAPTRTPQRAAWVPTISSDHLIRLPLTARGTTPNLLRAAAAAISVLTLAAAVTVTGFAGSAGARIAGVAGDDAPSVRATEDFVFQLQDMDAHLVNALLVNGDTGVRVPRAASVALYDRDRKLADGDLEAATAALAGDQDALNRLHAVVDTFGGYEAQAVRTLADDERDGGTAAGRAPASVLADYQGAHAILFGGDGSGGLLKAAEDLEQTSAAAIAGTSSAASDSLQAVIAAFALFGLALLGGLGALQVFLFRRFHRVVNPGLAAATVAALVFTVGGAVGTSLAANDFHTAKSNAFDSMLALTQAKALGSGANADESRWLLLHDHPEQRAAVEKSYLDGSDAVARMDVSSGPLDYDASLGTMDAWLGKRRAGREEAGVDDDRTITADDLTAAGVDPASALGREFGNITFDGEAGLAYQAFHTYDTYLGRDAQLRQLPLTTDDQLRAAVDFDTDAATPSTSDAAFDVYTTALDDVIDLNKTHFDSAMPAARGDVGVWTWLPYPLAVLVIGLMVLGLRPRLGEYR
ncbi:hypothetical protein [Catenulispora yoronensis]|uniref:hypothetical protein n=1 Tax=Catenulispora yoronensis TaxID=450799 RepID=UPI0031E39227